MPLLSGKLDPGRTGAVILVQQKGSVVAPITSSGGAIFVRPANVAPELLAAAISIVLKSNVTVHRRGIVGQSVAMPPAVRAERE